LTSVASDLLFHTPSARRQNYEILYKLHVFRQTRHEDPPDLARVRRPRSSRAEHPLQAARLAV